MTHFRRFVVMEELEVDKVYREEKAGATGNEFDELYKNVKQTQEIKEQGEDTEDDENPEDDSTDETTPDETGSADDATDDTAADEAAVPESAADSATASLEAFLSLHYQSRSEYVATEDIFTKEKLLHAAHVTGQAAVDGLKYLKDIGFQYGPVLLKHVYKGILFALNRTLRAIVRGSIAIARYIKKRMESYKNFKEKVAKAREVLDLIKEHRKDEEEKELQGNYENNVIISQLKIADHADFEKNAATALVFFKSFFDHFAQNVKSSIEATQHVINAVVNEQSDIPNKFSIDHIVWPGFVCKSVTGFVPTSDMVETYVYQHSLPGDFLFLGYLPKKDITEYSDAVSAFSESRMFLGVNEQAAATQVTAPFMTLEQMTKYLDSLDQLCDSGLKLEAIYESISETRKKVKDSLNHYTRFLLTMQDKISIRDSLAEFISVRVGLLDHTFIAGSMHINDYAVRFLSSSLTCIRDNLEVQS